MSSSQQLGLFGEKQCEFCGSFTDHGAAEIARLKADGWTQRMPANFHELERTGRRTSVPFCGHSFTVMWKPDTVTADLLPPQPPG